MEDTKKVGVVSGVDLEFESPLHSLGGAEIFI